MGGRRRPMLRVQGGAAAVAGRPALFLGRDGTVIPHRYDHVLLPEHVVPYDGVLEALAALADLDLAIAFTSNQSAPGRGLIDVAGTLALHDLVLDAIGGAGGRIDASFICPHAPDDGCGCRKPALGLFHAAIEALQPDLSRSAVVGDSVGDIVAAVERGQARLVAAGVGEKWR